MDVSYEGNATGNRLPIQFHNSLSPPEFPVIQGVVKITVIETPVRAELVIYNVGSFPPASLLVGG